MLDETFMLTEQVLTVLLAVVEGLTPHCSISLSLQQVSGVMWLDLGTANLLNEQCGRMCLVNSSFLQARPLKSERLTFNPARHACTLSTLRLFFVFVFLPPGG